MKLGLGLVGLLVVAAAAYYFMNNNNKKKSNGTEPLAYSSNEAAPGAGGGAQVRDNALLQGPAPIPAEEPVGDIIGDIESESARKISPLDVVDELNKHVNDRLVSEERNERPEFNRQTRLIETVNAGPGGGNTIVNGAALGPPVRLGSSRPFVHAAPASFA
jgi:hypothetical protein